MRLIISVLIGTALLGCKTSDFSKIELISTSGRVLDYKDTDSLIFGLYIHAYAQIDKDGNCLTVRESNNNDKRFDSFKIDKQLFKIISDRLITIDKDTLLTEKTSEGPYDGPIIQLFVHKDNGGLYRLTYIKSKRTDKDFLRLYKYIDSVSFENSCNNFDTVKLKFDRDKLIDKMKRDILKSGNTFDRDTIVIIK